LRSDKIKKGVERAPHRALLYATGVTKKSLSKPFVGIASSFSSIVPDHIQNLTHQGDEFKTRHEEVR